MKNVQIAARLVVPVILALASAAEGDARTYSTNFPLTENPISEDGNWTNGKTAGLDWANVKTANGVASGTESPGGYDDSTAILTGTWGPNQTCQATVHSVNQSSVLLEEVEFRLRSTVTAHRCTGYEVLFRAYHPGGYCTIVRWNGPLNDFTYLNQKPNKNFHGIADGDVVSASINGNTIIGYVNGVEVIKATDSTYSAGNPGIGFWLNNGGSIATNSDFGFTSFSASDSSSPTDVAGAATVELFVNTAQPAGAIDLSTYGLGQGGLSVEPMFDDHVDEIARLRPQTIRLFVQEYFNLYPAHGVYHWDTLDRSIENILATGARPLMCLCFKPRVLYPQVNQDIVHPTDYAEWEALIEALVRHCNQEKRYGINYWEVGNEVDIGESGGCPYRFQPADYTTYYTHTVNAIRRAQPTAKVGGPALAGYGSSIGDALIAYCGNGGAPMDFFSWHVYSSDPNSARSSIRAIRQKLAPYPALTNTETIIDEWNINLLGNEPTPGFQAAFVLEATSGFLAEGLSRAAYYHIRDHFVVPRDFAWMSPGGYQFMADWWNVQVQNSGLYDKQGRRRPAYYVFQMLGHLRGRQLPVTGVTTRIHALAALDGRTIHLVCWNFGGAATDVSVRFPAGQAGQFRFAQLNPTANRLETLRAGAAAELDANPLRLQIAPYGVAWAQVERSDEPPVAP